MLGMWSDLADNGLNIAWVRAAAAAMEPSALPGAYLNCLMDEGKGKASFGDHYARMVALKDRYDRTNLFQMNQIIKPGV